MIPEINYWAVIVATLSTIVVGSTWYAPKVFGARWAELTGTRTDGEAKDAIGPMMLTVIVSFVTAWVLAGATTIAWHFYQGSYLLSAVVTAALLWVGFTAARLITHDAFEKRPAQLTIMNISHEFVTILLMGIILGVWPPAGIVIS
ncbi:DUF1761 domain-containing protein [Microbacterium karelineae]|uniref:DUF1761 domain-containing protein n=1 Tax=Microbacterium karelineae TaxID=2654283 RepID=UPI0012E9AE17|nr:DUF1761 domain-containing protein [Microbacterium karelineae]